MRVREATSGDADRIAAFNRDLALETEGRAPGLDTLERGVARGLARPEVCRYWVAEIEGEVVGQAMVTYEWSDWRDGVFWWFQSVYVDPSARRRGVFRTLFSHIAELAESDPEVCGLRLYVESENERARSVYEKLGLAETNYRVLERDWSSAV